MKFKKMISALTVLTMVAGSFPVMGAPASVTLDSVIAQAADSTAVDDFLDSAFNLKKAEIRKDDAFNMNGRTYYEGIVFDNYGKNENACTASFNVENVDKFSFTLGHVDGGNTYPGKINIYLDDVFYDTIDLWEYMKLTDISIDVSESSVIRFNMAITADFQSGTYGIANIRIDEKSGKDYRLEEYSDVTDFITRSFNTRKTEIHNTPGDKRTAFNMNGRTYYEGIVFDNYGTNEHTCTASFNVENIDKFSFTLGHVDGGNTYPGKINIYLDDVFYDTIDLWEYMKLTDISIDVSESSVIRFNMAITADFQSGAYGIANIRIDEKSGKDYQLEEYSDVTDFITRSFNTRKIEIHNTPGDKRTAFNMNGHTYYEGIVFDNYGTNEHTCTASFNVENVGELSFTLGHVDGGNTYSGTLLIYLDDVLYDSVDTWENMNLTDISINVSKNSVIRFNMAITADFQSGAYGIADISITEKQDNTDSSLGDIDCDGKITGSDATFVLQAYTKMSSGQDSGMSDAQYKVADVDGDGIISGSDATLILRYYTKISSSTNGITSITMEEWLKIELN